MKVLNVLWKVLKCFILVLFGGFIGWIGGIIMQVIAWHNDRDGVIDVYDDAEAMWVKHGVFRD